MYTLEELKNAYAILIVSLNENIWVELNTGNDFVEYSFEFYKDSFKLSRISNVNYEEFYEWQEIWIPDGFARTVIAYDYENFIRHFGMHFLKF